MKLVKELNNKDYKKLNYKIERLLFDKHTISTIVEYTEKNTTDEYIVIITIYVKFSNQLKDKLKVGNVYNFSEIDWAGDIEIDEIIIDKNLNYDYIEPEDVLICETCEKCGNEEDEG